MSPKNVRLESIRHLILRAMERLRSRVPAKARAAWEELASGLKLEKTAAGELEARWSGPKPGSLRVDSGDFTLYRRNDDPGKPAPEEAEDSNRAAADTVVERLAESAGLEMPTREGALAREEAFHDAWAGDTRPEDVMVKESFEARTAPENRFILELLGDVRGKRLLDLGSGLGEAAVYFATRGAEVTACDLSSGMLETASSVAEVHKVSIQTRHAPAEKTGLPDGSFDVVYAGNLLHHVEIAPVLDEAKRLLRGGGTFVSWDPLAHNPVINVYRRMASDVRTPDEHPLTMSDLRMFTERFRDTGRRFFWLSTLAVFLRFYLWERVHPSKERYWKKILTDEKRLSGFYGFLETLDRGILTVLPFLGRYCWNVVVWGRK